MAGVVVIAVWAGSVGARLRLPYILPMAIMMVGGLIAAFVNGSISSGIQAVLQELFLLAWCGALVTLFRSPSSAADDHAHLGAEQHRVGRVPRGGHPDRSERLGRGGHARRVMPQRVEVAVQLTFDHPNMAGNYFMISLFVVLASGYPKHRLLRAGGCIVLLMAMLYAGSNTALARPAHRPAGHGLRQREAPDGPGVRGRRGPLHRAGRWSGVDGGGAAGDGVGPVQRQPPGPLLGRPERTRARTPESPSSRCSSTSTGGATSSGSDRRRRRRSSVRATSRR